MKCMQLWFTVLCLFNDYLLDCKAVSSVLREYWHERADERLGDPPPKYN